MTTDNNNSPDIMDEKEIYKNVCQKYKYIQIIVCSLIIIVLLVIYILLHKVGILKLGPAGLYIITFTVYSIGIIIKHKLIDKEMEIIKSEIRHETNRKGY